MHFLPLILGTAGHEAGCNCLSFLQARTHTYNLLMPPLQIKAGAYTKDESSPQSVCTNKQSVSPFPALADFAKPPRNLRTPPVKTKENYTPPRENRLG